MTKGTKAKTAKGSKSKAPVAKKAASTKKPVVKKKPEVKKAAAKPVAKKAPVVKKKPEVKKPEIVKVKKAVPAKKPVPVKAAPVKAVKVVPVKKAAPVKAVVPVKPVTPVVIPRAKVATTNVTILPPDYDPKKDKGDFMNPVMLEYFRQKLIRWREELLRESSETIHQTLQSTELQKPDLADRASAETDHALELRTRDRERKLISKINEALLRIEDGTYGYCEESAEPIGVARLDARPNSTLSIEAQDRHERLEKTRRDE